MRNTELHHVSLVSRNVPRSIAFYRDTLGLPMVERPAFKIAGAWFRLGTLEIHLIDRPDGRFRNARDVDSDDVHFAIRVMDFEDTIHELVAKGFREDVPPDDPMHILVRRNSMAGYHQAYIRDPDNHVIEINAAQ